MTHPGDLQEQVGGPETEQAAADLSSRGLCHEFPPIAPRHPSPRPDGAVVLWPGGVLLYVKGEPGMHSPQAWVLQGGASRLLARTHGTVWVQKGMLPNEC